MNSLDKIRQAKKETLKRNKDFDNEFDDYFNKFPKSRIEENEENEENDVCTHESTSSKGIGTLNNMKWVNYCDDCGKEWECK